MGSNIQSPELEEMIGVNDRQAEFYESIQCAEISRRDNNRQSGDGYSSNAKAGLFTRVWARLRDHRKRLLKNSGFREQIEAKLRDLVGDEGRGRVLEIGCFNGTRNTLWLVEQCSFYTGMDLSQSAIEVLRGKIEERGWSAKTQLVAGDILKFESDRKYDLIYAQGVLHHFKHPDVIFPALRGLLNDRGVLVFSDPSEVNPFLSFFRKLYRPFQSDQAWEWPFTSKTVSALEASFTIRSAFGFGRWSTLLVPLVSIPGVGHLLGGVYQKLLDWELNRPFDSKAVWQQAVVYGIAERKDLASEAEFCANEEG